MASKKIKPIDEVKRLKKELRKTTSALRDVALNAGENVPAVNYSNTLTAQVPTVTDLSSIFLKCEELATADEFLRNFLPFKVSMYNSGFRVAAADGKESSQKKLKKELDEELPPVVDTWTDSETQQTITIESTQTVREAINTFANQVWFQQFLYENVVAVWFDDRPVPIVMDIKKCRYSDTMGVELLRYTHGLSTQQVSQLSDSMKDAFKSQTVLVNPDIGMHFKVLKNTLVGQGFGVPPLYAAFLLLGETNSKARGHYAMSFLLRTAKRMHQLGHEIKQGQHAGKNLWFWNKKRDTEVKKFWVDKEGAEDTTANFDHKVLYPWPESKLFKREYYEDSDDRLCKWGGPLAGIIVKEKINPIAVNVLRQHAEEERKKVGAMIAWCVQKALGVSFPIECQFDSTVFNEARLQFEMMKFSQMQGMQSVQTFQQFAGMVPIVESERKLMEASDKDAKAKFTPMWDTSHGIQPALGEQVKAAGDKKPGGENGRPAGKKKPAA